MKKIISSFLVACGLFCQQAAQSAQPAAAQEISGSFADTNGVVKISVDRRELSLDFNQKPFGEEGKRSTLAAHMSTAFDNNQPFCFMLCQTREGDSDKQIIIRTDRNLHPTCTVETPHTVLAAYRLHEDGTCRSYQPEEIQTAQTLHGSPEQHVVTIPYNVYVDRPVLIPGPPVFVPGPIVREIIDRPVPVTVYVPVAKQPSRRRKRAQSEQVPDAAATQPAPTTPAAPQHLLAVTPPSASSTSPVTGSTSGRATAELQKLLATMVLSAQGGEARQPEAPKEAAETRVDDAQGSTPAQPVASKDIDAVAQEPLQQGGAAAASEAAPQTPPQEPKTKKQEREERRKAEEARQKAQEEAKKAREEQAQRDREAAAVKKAEQDAQKAAKKAEGRKAAPTTPAPQQKAPSSSKAATSARKPDSKKSDDDAILAAAMAQAAREKAKQPTPPTEAMQQKPRKTARELAEQKAATAAALSSMAELQSVADKELEARISALIQNGNFTEAKALLPQIAHLPSLHTCFMCALCNEAPEVLSDEETAAFLEKAKWISKDKTVDAWTRCNVYFVLHSAEPDEDKKDAYLEQCIRLDEDHCHDIAQGTKLLIDLNRADQRNPQCRIERGMCPHLKSFIFARNLNSVGDLYITTAQILFKTYLHAHRKSCEQMAAFVATEGKDPAKEIRDLYQTCIDLENGYDSTELALINAIIPEDVIPADQRRH